MNERIPGQAFPTLTVCRVPVRFVVRLVLAFVCGWTGVPAHAKPACKFSVTAPLAFGSISIPAGAAKGATVATLASIPIRNTCKLTSYSPIVTSTTVGLTLSAGSPKSGYLDVYPTGIEWLGIRYVVNMPACRINNVAVSYSLAIQCPFSGTIDAPAVPLDSAMSITASLVVTGVVGSGTADLAPPQDIRYELSYSPGGFDSGAQFVSAATGRVTRSTCSVSQPNVSVALPPVYAHGFASGIGAVAGPQPFALNFSCAAGTRLSMGLTDSVDPSNFSNTLQLDAASTARGVGIQVLNATGSPVSFGPDSAAPGGQNQWPIGNAPSGALQIPLTARYIRTGDVSSGTVKALATFTMSYQ